MTRVAAGISAAGRALESNALESPLARPDKALLDDLLRRSLVPLALGLSILYAVLAAIKPWADGTGLDSPPVIWLLFAWNAALSAAFALAYFLMRRPAFGHARAHVLLAVFVVAVATDGFLHLVLLSSTLETISFILIIVGIAFFVTELGWFIGLEAMVILAWVAGSSLVNIPLEMRVDYAIQVMTASFLSVIVFAARRRTIRRLEVLHARDERTNLELENTLAELKRSEIRFRLFAENAQDIIYRLSVEPRRAFEYVSPSASQASGRPADAFYADADILRQLVHPDDVSTLEACFGQGLPEPFVLRWRLANGNIAWMEHREVAIRDPSGQTVAIEGIARDVTQQKRIEIELRDSRDRLKRLASQLQDANQELEAFSYSTSHDLKAPLRGIDVYSTALLEDYGPRLDEEARELLGRLREESKRMTQLVNDFLSLSRVARGHIGRSPVDLTKEARSIVEGLRAIEPDHDVELICPEHLIVHGDPTLLRALVENLVGNAWKFTRDVENPTIEIGEVNDGLHRTFFVRDNGIGFDMDQADRLFRPFQRLATSSTYEGSGIGLATVQRIVHRHGGTVWATGKPGEGAAFFFTVSEKGADAQAKPENGAASSGTA